MIPRLREIGGNHFFKRFCRFDAGTSVKGKDPFRGFALSEKFSCLGGFARKIDMSCLDIRYDLQTKKIGSADVLLKEQDRLFTLAGHCDSPHPADSRQGPDDEQWPAGHLVFRHRSGPSAVERILRMVTQHIVAGLDFVCSALGQVARGQIVDPERERTETTLTLRHTHIPVHTAYAFPAVGQNTLHD